jgi:hypothetical protein
LARIVYAHSLEQLAQWRDEFGAAPPPLRTLPVHEVAPDVQVEGPVRDLALRVRELHRQFQQNA